MESGGLADLAPLSPSSIDTGKPSNTPFLSSVSGIGCVTERIECPRYAGNLATYAFGSRGDKMVA